MAAGRGGSRPGRWRRPAGARPRRARPDAAPAAGSGCRSAPAARWRRAPADARAADGAAAPAAPDRSADLRRASRSVGGTTRPVGGGIAGRGGGAAASTGSRRRRGRRLAVLRRAGAAWPVRRDGRRSSSSAWRPTHGARFRAATGSGYCDGLRLAARALDDRRRRPVPARHQALRRRGTVGSAVESAAEPAAWRSSPAAAAAAPARRAWPAPAPCRPAFAP